MEDNLERNLNLVPGEKYLLKWVTINPNTNNIHNMVVLECEFIKYNNNQYYTSFMNYLDNEEIDPELENTLITNNENQPDHENQPDILIQYPFEHELYPYAAGLRANKFFENLGLFKFIRVVNQFFKGENRPFRGNNPYNFVSLKANTLINTDNLINNETLMWVNLDSVVIRPKLDTDKMIQEKGIDVIADNMTPENTNEIIPEDVRRYTKEFVGGKKTKKNKRKTRKTKRNKKRRKTRKQ